MISQLHTEIQEPEKSIDQTNSKRKIILFVGLNGKAICEGLMSYNYTGLSLPSFTKALFWLKNQILSTLNFCIKIRLLQHR